MVSEILSVTIVFPLRPLTTVGPVVVFRNRRQIVDVPSPGLTVFFKPVPYGRVTP